MDNNKMGFNLKEVILIIIVTAILTSLTTGVIVYNQNKVTKNLTYKDLNNDENLKDFLNVYASLIDEYYESVDKKEMLESAINAMLNYLGEDYSTYMTKEETDSLASKLMGEYKGIGITLNNEKEIVGFIENSPAEEAGMLQGDFLIGIDGNDATNMTSKEISTIIAGIDEGKKISVKVKRDEEVLDFEVENRKLIISSIEYNNKDEIGYLKISTFSNNLGEQVKKALENMEKENIKSLIIDLRDNTGGYLNAAKDVASIFLEKGKIIYSLEEKDSIKEYKDTSDEKREYKIVLLFNENSASASEVLIAALQENYGAVTVGKNSYGKGKVQQTYGLDDGSMVKYTSARWLTPSGECIDGWGIMPDYNIDNGEDSEVDLQLEKAYELARE